MKKIIRLVCLMIFFSSCVFSRIDNSVDLGSHYRCILETPQTIIYHESSEYEGSGKEIIPPIVLSYRFNDYYIIAKSQRIDENTGTPYRGAIRYWIIDKTTKGASVDYMDSITFIQKLKDLNIDLSLW